MRPTFLDKAISYLAPAAAVKRMRHRRAFQILSRDYEGASLGRTSSAGWRGIGSSADELVSISGATLRDRMRELNRNNPHAARGTSALVTNIVGTGITPRPKHPNKTVNKKVTAAFERWAKACDADGMGDFYGLQTLLCREMIEAGEVLARRRLRRVADGVPSNLQIQVVEADLLDSGKSGPMPGGNIAIQGVELNGIGKRTAYWLFPFHPGSGLANSIAGQLSSGPVPAEDVLHLYERQRTQTRGVPWGAPVMAALRDLADFEAAELMRKKIEACMVGIVTGGDENDMGLGIPLGAEEKPGVVDAQGALIERFEPGMFAYARGGRDIKFNSPAASTGYETYKRSLLHSVAAGYRVPYELLTGDLSQVNYSSIRAGLVEFRRLVTQLQWQVFIPLVCDRIWEWWTEAAYVAGEIPTKDVPVVWSPPKFWSVDPLSDARADLIAMRSGIRSLKDVIAENGDDPDEKLQEIADTFVMLDNLKLIFDSDPRHRTQVGNLAEPNAAGGDGKPAPTG